MSKLYKIKIVSILFIIALLVNACASESLSEKVHRTQTNIKIVLDSHKENVFEIYTDELKVSPKLEGKVALKLLISPTGSVTSVSVHKTTIGNSGFLDKLQVYISEMDFGAKNVDTTTLFYDFNFLPY